MRRVVQVATVLIFGAALGWVVRDRRPAPPAPACVVPSDVTVMRVKGTDPVVGRYTAFHVTENGRVARAHTEDVDQDKAFVFEIRYPNGSALTVHTVRD